MYYIKLRVGGVKTCGINRKEALMGDIVCTCPLSAGGAEPPTKFSERVDLTGTQFLEGVAEKEWGDLFFGGGGAIFM